MDNIEAFIKKHFHRYSHLHRKKQLIPSTKEFWIKTINSKLNTFYDCKVMTLVKHLL